MSLKLFELVGTDAARPFSPFCWRTRMALAHKGLSAETIPWCFTEKDAIAPHQSEKVPVLIDGDNSVADSWAIANYLEDRYPDRPSLFGGEGGRAMGRMINWWGDIAVVGGMFPLIVADIPRASEAGGCGLFPEKPRGALRQAAGRSGGRRATSPSRAFAASLEPMRLTLKTQAFLGGVAPNYADYIVFGPFQWARVVSPFKLLAEDDPVHAWRERLLDAFDRHGAEIAGLSGVAASALRKAHRLRQQHLLVVAEPQRVRDRVAVDPGADHGREPVAGGEQIDVLRDRAGGGGSEALAASRPAPASCGCDRRRRRGRAPPRRQNPDSR